MMSIRITLLCMFMLALGACSAQPLKPWERGTLAKKEMAWSPDPLEEKLKQHVYFSKEGSSGGGHAAGGGCGCN